MTSGESGDGIRDGSGNVRSGNVGGGGFDIASVATHEFGHTFGLGHPSGNHPSLTMNAYSAGTCQSSKRSLGRGDVIGLGRIYR
jgi:hypothetical protein